MNNTIIVPNPLLDNRELDKIDSLTSDYEKYNESGKITNAVSNKSDSHSEHV